MSSSKRIHSSSNWLPANRFLTRPSEAKEPASEATCQRAADIFRALGDPTRLRTLVLLLEEEMCVSDIAEALDDNLPAVSQRLKLLRKDHIVDLRRDGKFVFYSLADIHVRQLIINVIERVQE